MTTCDMAAVGWVIALFAIFINNRQANQRETRKEIRSKLDKLNNAFEILLDASRNYYLDESAKIHKETIRIHESINVCDRYIEELSQLENGVSLQTDFYIIFDLVTGKDFESSNHLAGKHYTPLCKKLSLQKESLIKRAEDWFRITFQ